MLLRRRLNNMNEIIINGIIERSQEVSGEMRYAVGAPGADGVGISDIFKTSTVGNVDTYTIFLTDGTTKTFTVTNGIENIDQTYSPTSENAQSGIAVAQAIDPRTVYQKFIDDNKLKQRKWVDLSFVGGEYYYTDFLQAVADVNADTTENSTTDSTSAVCQIFKNEEITVLRLSRDISVTTNIVFEKSVIFDINGFTVSLSNNGSFGTVNTSGTSTKYYNTDVVYYGTKSGSAVIGTDVLALLWLCTKNTFIIGGAYKQTCNTKGVANIEIFNPTIDLNIDVVNCFIYSYSNRTYGASLQSSNIYCHNTNDKSINVKIQNSKLYIGSANNECSCVKLIPQTDVIKCDFIIKDCSLEAISADLEDGSSKAIYSFAEKLTAINCKLYGITSGISNHGTLYLQNCKCHSPYHGGVYNATNGVLYAENCEFHRSVCPDGYTPSGWAASYFGYSSTAYLNDCSFILDTKGDTSDGIAIKQGDTTEPTYVYMSNCELPKLRCDSGQYVYLGEGISDTIRNTTVNGTKVLTDKNYSTYINKEMSQPVIDIEYEPTSRSPQSGIAVAEAVVEAKDYTDTKIGDIDTALDNIIALQNSYIGGNA